MSKIDTAKKLASLAAKHPSSYAKAAKYAIKYGLSGLRDRFHQEIVLDDVALPKECADPGSETGSIQFSIVMPVFNVDIKWLDLAISSVENQTYDNWELCIVDDASPNREIRDYLASRQNAKIKIRLLSSNSGISSATNAAAELASGNYIVLLDNDDFLRPTALAELFIRASLTNADIMYTDNDVIDESGQRLSVLHKPDWSPDLILSQMYVGHLLAFKRELFFAVGGFRSECNGSQDYDLFLRMTERSASIEHIPEVLYSWRSLETSTATNPEAKPYAQIAGKKAVQSHVDAIYGEGFCRVDETKNLFVYDVRYPVQSNTLASIIIPTKDHIDDLKKAITSIFEKTVYESYEIVVLDNNSTEPLSFDYFAKLEREHDNVRVVPATYPFNWSKLNNQGIQEAQGDVFVFLNNDVEILSEDWLSRLVENALREDIGAVGGLLLYPDGTIQHAGVVIGMGGWADHVYKGMRPLHIGDPFISPMVTRNVAAVTGACMSISRSTIEEIGGFNEKFIVCGSDVEICLRAIKFGKNNLYVPQVQLMHYESKTRDPKKIPSTDFKLSEAAYRTYLASGDPFFNKNLDYASCAPKALSNREKLQRGVNKSLWVSEDAIRPLLFSQVESKGKRLNLLIPSINPEDIYGGISTALKFFERLASDLQCRSRIIVLDGEPRYNEVLENFPSYAQANMGDNPSESQVIVSAVNRNSSSLTVSEDDWFVATAWWTAYCYQNEYQRQMECSPDSWLRPLIYLIQDYEPGFYAWSSQYLLAQSTYTSNTPTIAIFNSTELESFFSAMKCTFDASFSFEPFLNGQLAQSLSSLNGKTAKRKQILIYGRPGTPRNAFSLIVEALRIWITSDKTAKMWDFISAGEQHPPVYLAEGRYLTSVGKQTLEGYAQLLSESYAGISLMVSPHPSYPPLEMASFGVNVITNTFEGKNLSAFSSNIISLERATPHEIASTLQSVCGNFASEVPCGKVSRRYLQCPDPFPFMKDLVEKIMS